MKSDMAHMTAVSTSSHRNPRCILRELRQASEGGLTEALRESDGAGRKPQLSKKKCAKPCRLLAVCVHMHWYQTRRC